MDDLLQRGGGRGRRPGRPRGQRGGRGGNRSRRRGPVEVNRERHDDDGQLNGHVVEAQHGRGHQQHGEGQFRGRGARAGRGRGRGRRQGRGYEPADRGEHGGGRAQRRGGGGGTQDVSGVPRVYLISDRFLRELREKSSREITMEVSTKLDSFKGLLNSRQVGVRDRLRLILSLFAKGCRSTMNQMLNDMLACMLSSLFFTNNLNSYLSTLTQTQVMGYTNVEEVVEDLESIVTLVNEMLERFPSKVDEIVVLDRLKVTVDQLSCTTIPLPNGLIERVTDLVKTRDECIVQNQLRLEHSSLPQAMKVENPPDDFRGIEIVPTSEELAKNEQPFLRSNIEEGAFKDLDHYLDVQFRLLREDFVGPLREGIATLPEDDVRRKRGSSNDLRL